jgi:hypothetical protein
VSAFIIVLITLDRFLVLRFPFSRLHFRPASAHATCALLWVVGALLAAVPLLPWTPRWDFYSQTGLCIPLAVSTKAWSGQRYSFGVIIVLNLALFLLIAVGQLLIYWSIRTNSMSAANTSRQSKDLVVARRLITIAMSDFVCWFPVGVLGQLAEQGVAIPGEVGVAVTVLLLPLNSALNPFLYTLNVVLEKKQRAKEMRLKKWFYSQSQHVKTAVSSTTHVVLPMIGKQ